MNIGSGLQVACTQPHRLAATELASRVADEMGVVLGEEVGYQIGGVSMINKNKQKKTRLAYMTEGVLLRQLSMDRQTVLHHYEARTRRKIKISLHDSRRQIKSSLANSTLFSSNHGRF
ncbi:Pre-mRNA-splicing factor ATP-dependent RNA helicase [Trichoderma lentiforme]|uniref:Pre-mRNA-splicing factor ATP-dependent RNA helicase n=1 Tax=Trichoderma lentiforme TaxID=1567552 RepID=A0A9P5CC09_9HYPO|nr:Pre-mRNA-splicing factor ATP-dependent RNA helicase [Trichoderma lentiforme]